MNMRQIDVFKAIMAAGSTVLAAQRLGISQPAISKHLKEIEESVGLPLFERAGGRLLPTPEARVMFDRLDRMEIGLSQFNRFIGDLRETRKGRLSMIVMPLMLNRQIPDLLREFLAVHPEVDLVLHSHGAPQMFHSVALGEADLAIDVSGREHADLTAEPLIDLQLACILPTSHPLAARDSIGVDDLAGECIVLLRNLDLYPVLLDAMLPPSRVKFRRRIDVFQSVLAFELVSRGLGIGVVDMLTIHDLRHPGIAVVPFVPVTKLEVVVLTSKRWPVSKLARAFIRSTKEHFTRLEPALLEAIHAGRQR